MIINVNLKKIGGRNKKIQKRELYLENTPKTTRDLIIEVVRTTVKEYCDKKDDIIDYLQLKDIENKATIGKISNNQSNDDRLPNLQEAIDNALLSFEDNLVKIFLEDKELKSLDENIEIKEYSNLTFIKMVMLSGRRY